MAGPVRKILCAGALLVGKIPVLGYPARELARSMAGTYKERRFLAGLLPSPYISPRAQVRLRGPKSFGRDVFIDDGCVLFAEGASNHLVLGDHVSVYRNTVMHIGGEGGIEIGDDTHIQNDCQFTAFGPLVIGRDVQIAPNCSFYPYDHSFEDMTVPIRKQPLRCKGGIRIGDDAWLGVGVIVLDGVRIGEGAVVGAGSVVTRDIPDRAIAAGSPAKVIAMRGTGTN